jgi:hypothetical protein
MLEYRQVTSIYKCFTWLNETSVVKSVRAHSPHVITHRSSAWYESKRKVLVQRVKETAMLCRSFTPASSSSACGMRCSNAPSQGSVGSWGSRVVRLSLELQHAVCGGYNALRKVGTFRWPPIAWKETDSCLHSKVCWPLNATKSASQCSICGYYRFIGG